MNITAKYQRLIEALQDHISLLKHMIEVLNETIATKDRYISALKEANQSYHESHSYLLALNRRTTELLEWLVTEEVCDKQGYYVTESRQFREVERLLEKAPIRRYNGSK